MANVLDRGFYSLLTKSLLDLTELIVVADFNAVWNYRVDRSTGAESREQAQSSAELRAWAGHTGLANIWRLMNPSARDYSFFSRQHSLFSRIDLIFTSVDLFHKIGKVDLLPVAFTPQTPL